MSSVNPLLTTVNDSACKRKGMVMLGGAGRLGGCALLAAMLLTTLPVGAPALAQGYGQPGPSYQIISQDPNGVEVRFRGLPLKAVQADDNQNALSINFQTAVDGAAFDRLAADLPAWVSMAYANFDNGVIRSPRPVTFLTRAEPDGFSLRIVPRAGAPMPQGAPLPPPPQMRGGLMEGAPPQAMPRGVYVPPQAAFHTYDEYAALRNYEAQVLSVRRGDSMWGAAYGRAAMQSDSSLGLNTEANWYHGGDVMVTSELSGKYSVAPGLAIVGSVKYTDVTGRNVRAPNGALVARTATQLVTGMGGVALELGRDSEVRLEASEGNNVTGGRFSLYSGDPNGFAYLRLDYHTPYLDTPTAVWNRGATDRVVAGFAHQIGYGFWGGLSGNYTRYGIRGDADVARTAGWDGNLRWNTDIWGGLLAGVSYDGHGEYRIGYDTRTGAAPSPYVPLGIRNIETHAVTLGLSSTPWQGLWFNAYGGYISDRYASDGLLAGLELHYMPAAGVDVALGIRHAAVTSTQGMTGRQTSAGLNVTLGFGAPPQPSWMANMPMPGL